MSALRNVQRRYNNTLWAGRTVSALSFLPFVAAGVIGKKTGLGGSPYVLLWGTGSLLTLASLYEGKTLLERAEAYGRRHSLIEDS